MPATLERKPLLKSFAITRDMAQAEGNTLCCVPSVMGVLDWYDDVIFPGAFKDALPQFLRRGFVPTDHDWRWEKLVGMPKVAYERGAILYSEFEFHSDQASQDAKIKCQERLDNNLEVGLSVGFMMSAGGYLYFNNGKELIAYARENKYDLKLFDVKGIEAHNAPCQAILKADELMEYSLTPCPANTQAGALAIKSAGGRVIYLSARALQAAAQGTKSMSEHLKRIKSICGARDLGLAAKDRKWSASEADKRVKAWADATDEPNEKYAKAFTVCSGPKDEFDSYHLPFADVIDGKLVAIPKAIEAIAGVLDGSRGGVDLNEKDRAGAKSFVEAYYAKMRTEFDDDDIQVPWDAESEKSAHGTPMFKGQYLGDYVERAMCMSAVHQATYQLHAALSQAMDGSGEWEGLPMDDVMEGIGAGFDEHKDLCMSVIRAIMCGKGAESREEAAEASKSFLVSTLSANGLGSGLSFADHAEVAADAVQRFLERSLDRIEKRLKSNPKRTLSEQNRSEIKQLCDRLERQVTELKDLHARSENKSAAKKSSLVALRARAERIRVASLVLS